jgi:ADP-ribose pyrophosphatase YjhB (NUDIX family)
VRKESSAGGLVVREGKVLLVQVKNLEGVIRWTFPKGHLEPGETARQAALREVQEETGWACRILEPLTTARYHFFRKGREVAKQVQWYLMAPVKKVGGRDVEEIMAVRWSALAAARRLIIYPSDIELFEAYDRRGGK